MRYGAAVNGQDLLDPEIAPLTPTIDLDGLDEGAYRIAVWKTLITTSNKEVRRKADERALAAGGAQ